MSDFKYTLAEITADFRQILDMMDDPELDPQTLADTMEGIKGAFEDKFDGYAGVIRYMDSQITMLDEEKKRLDSRITTWKNNVKRMKENMLFAMKATGQTKFKTAQNSFWVQKTPESVVIDVKSFKEIPEEFLRYRDPEPDKTKMKEAIKAGKLEGIAHLEQSETVRMK